jgi:hypothetical protein
MARPTKCTPAVTRTVAKALAEGNPQWVAGMIAGICADAFGEWMTRGARGEEPFAAFHREIERAKAAAIARKVSHIEKAARNGSWQAAAWSLERRAPKDFAAVEKRNLEDNLEEQARLQSLSREQTIQLMREAQAKLQAKIDQLSEVTDG